MNGRTTNLSLLKTQSALSLVLAARAVGLSAIPEICFAVEPSQVRDIIARSMTKSPILEIEEMLISLWRAAGRHG